MALNVVTTVLMLLYRDQALLLAVAFALGGVAQLLVQLPTLTRAGLLPRLGVWWHPQLRRVLLLMVPFTFTTGARQLLALVSSRLLSALPAVGSVTAYANADLFLSLALGLFSISPALAFYSRLASLVGEPKDFRQTLLTGLRLITFLTVPAGLLLALYAGPAVESVLNWSTLLGGDGVAQQDARPFGLRARTSRSGSLSARTQQPAAPHLLRPAARPFAGLRQRRLYRAERFLYMCCWQIVSDWA